MFDSRAQENQLENTFYVANYIRRHQELLVTKPWPLSRPLVKTTGSIMGTIVISITPAKDLCSNSDKKCLSMDFKAIFFYLLIYFSWSQLARYAITFLLLLSCMFSIP